MVPLKRANAMLASLLMHCFHCILTSRISQALLQAALDKEPSVLHGWLTLREFSKVTSHEASARQPPEEASIDDDVTGGMKKLHQDQPIKINLPSLAIRSRVSKCQYPWLFF
jgi:hypothetical protein